VEKQSASPKEKTAKCAELIEQAAHIKEGLFPPLSTLTAGKSAIKECGAEKVG